MRDHHMISRGGFSIRVQQFSEATGNHNLTTILFDGVRLPDLLEVIEKGGRVKIDTVKNKVKIKRSIDCTLERKNQPTYPYAIQSDPDDVTKEVEHPVGDKSFTDSDAISLENDNISVAADQEHPKGDKTFTDGETQSEEFTKAYGKLTGLLPDVIRELIKMGPGFVDDFVSVLNALSKGYISENISFHLILDIGRFYGNSTVSNMRYSEEPMSFWVTIERLFKGRGINFFRGYKARGIGSNCKPEDCRINWIVPNDTA